MGNLGEYQDIVTQAKSLGGVGKLIAQIEDGAIAKATPGLLAKGIAIGALAMTGVGATAWRLRVKLKASERAASEAKEQLLADLEMLENPGDGDADREDPADLHRE